MTGRVAPRFFRSMIAALALSASAGVLAQPLPTASPDSVGMSAERLERITATFTKEIEDKKLPGAVVMVARHGSWCTPSPSAASTTRPAQHAGRLDLPHLLDDQAAGVHGPHDAGGGRTRCS